MSCKILQPTVPMEATGLLLLVAGCRSGGTLWGDLAVVHAKLIPVARRSSADTFMSLRFGSRRKTLLLKTALMGGVAHNFTEAGATA